MTNPTNQSPRILIIGAGPSGLATAAALQRKNISFLLVDRHGAVGGSYTRINPRMILAAPARYSSLAGLPYQPADDYGTVRDLHAYLQQFAEKFSLQTTKAEVSSVSPLPGKFTARFHSASLPETNFDGVVVATGVFDFPKPISIAGFPPWSADWQARPSILHGSQWPGADKFAGRQVLVIGCGISGAEIAEECAQSGLPVMLSVRHLPPRLIPPRLLGRDLHDFVYLFGRIPKWIWPSYCTQRPALPGIDRGLRQFVHDGQIILKPEIERWEAARILFRDQSECPADVVVAATGYHFAAPFLPTDEPRAEGGHPLARNGESRKYPGLYYVGSPCASGLDSEFLHGIARDAEIVANKINRRLAG